MSPETLCQVASRHGSVLTDESPATFRSWQRPSPILGLLSWHTELTGFQAQAM